MTDDPTDLADRPQHPYVDSNRSQPSDAAPRVVTLVGFLADSDRPGVRRIYFTGKLDAGAEFKTEDAIAVSDIAADQSPFVGETAISVTIREGAQIEFVQARTTDDLFDIDLRDARVLACNCPCPRPPQVDICYYKGSHH